MNRVHILKDNISEILNRVKMDFNCMFGLLLLSMIQSSMATISILKRTTGLFPSLSIEENAEKWRRKLYPNQPFHLVAFTSDQEKNVK